MHVFTRPAQPPPTAHLIVMPRGNPSTGWMEDDTLPNQRPPNPDLRESFWPDTGLLNLGSVSFTYLHAPGSHTRSASSRSTREVLLPLVWSVAQPLLHGAALMVTWLLATPGLPGPCSKAKLSSDEWKSKLNETQEPSCTFTSSKHHRSKL